MIFSSSRLAAIGPVVLAASFIYGCSSDEAPGLGTTDEDARPSEVADVADAIDVGDVGDAVDGVAETSEVGGGADAGDADVSDGTRDTGCGATVLDAAEAGAGPTKLLDGNLGLVGVTADGYAVVRESTTTAIKVVSLAGCGAETIVGSSDTVVIVGRVVFAWHDPDATTLFPKLTVWTSANGAKDVATSSDPSYASATDDGALIAFTDHASIFSGDEYAEIKTAKTDGTASKIVVLKTAFSSGGCQTGGAFAGTRLVTSHCVMPSADGGTITQQLSSIDPVSGTLAKLGDGVSAWSADKAGTKVFMISGAGAGSIIPIAGGAPTAIDADVAEGKLLSDGSGVVYWTNAGALRHSTVIGTPAKTTLVASGVKSLYGLSPDDKWVLYGKTDDDRNISSTTVAGSPPTPLLTTGTLPAGSDFTADSSRALFIGSLSSVTGLGAFKSRAITDSVIATHGSTEVWTKWATTGTRVVFNDKTDKGTSDIKVVDTAKSDAPTLVVAGAHSEMFLDPSKGKVVYTLPSGGVWVAAIP